MEKSQINNFVYHTPDLWESAETVELDKAMVQFNSKLSSVPRVDLIKMELKNGGTLARKIASLDEIMKIARPLLAENKLYIQQPVADDKMLILLKHESGQFRCVSHPMLAWTGQNTNPLQNMGGAISYLRRYLLTSFLAITTEEDDDGNSAGKAEIKRKAVAPTPTSVPALDESVVDAWQSKVSGCKVASDFENLSGELRDLGLDDLHPVKVFVKAAMSKRMKAVGIEFNRENNVFQPIEKPAPTEKQA